MNPAPDCSSHVRTTGFRILLTALALWGAVPAALAQNEGTVTGQVVNQATGNSLANAVVTLAGTANSVLTDRDGRFVLLRVPAGPQALTVTYPGLDDQNTTVDARSGTSTTADISMSAALYTMEVRDEIHLDPFSNGIGNTNLPPSRRRGLELDGQWFATPNVTLGAAYSYIDATFREGVLPGSAFSQLNVQLAGRSVPLVPRNKLSVNAAWALNANTRMSATANYVGAQFMDKIGRAHV